MDDDLWIHSEEGFRRTLLGLLERIAEALEVRNAPVSVVLDPIIDKRTGEPLTYAETVKLARLLSTVAGP